MDTWPLPHFISSSPVLLPNESKQSHQNLALPGLAVFSAAFLTGCDDDVSDENDNSFEASDEQEPDDMSAGDASLQPEEEEAFEYLADAEELSNMKTEIIEGDKEGSRWLVLDDVFILHKYGFKSKNEIFWECAERRRNGCNYKAATIIDDEVENPVLSYAYKLDTHSCCQSKAGPIMRKFRNVIKRRMASEYKTHFRIIFEQERKALLQKYKDQPDLLETIVYELKARKCFRVMANRARQRAFPRNPQSHEEIDLSRIGLKHLLIGHCAHSDPEIKNKEVFLFGTPLTAEAFAKAEFKSADGTFKICPKLFYQVFVLMALYGGVYVPCLFGLLPDKSEDSYTRFFGMLWAYNDQNGLPNDFRNEFFMCDFEHLIRSSILLYYPYLKVLGCYFHFSQLVWRRVKSNGFQVVYDKNDKFSAIIRRMSALPFTPKNDLDKAFEIFNTRTEALEEEDLKLFCKEIIEYLNNTWRHGAFAVQDWNLSDINLMIVPATNNGQEGSNRRFKEDFGVHPSFWSFVLTMNDELERVEADIKSILFGILVPETNEMYQFLKEQREISKANYEAGLISLDDYLGRVGALSLKVGKQKVASDDNEDNSRKGKATRSGPNDRIPNATSKPPLPSKPKGRKGRAPNILNKARPTQSNAIPEECEPSSTETEGPNVQVNPISSGLPWPSRTGIQGRPVLPSSKSRTTSSAAPCPPASAAAARPPTVNISTNLGSNNSLVNHIDKYGLGLRQRDPIAGDGNCWYASNVDLIKKFNIPAPTNHEDLRKAVVKSMETHPQMRQWVQTIFRGKKRDYNRFLREQKEPGVFTDNNGMAVIATADYLKVNYHLVGTSNTEQAPVSKIGREDEERVVFHIGYHQDTTDNPECSNPKAGHYQSLEKVLGRAVSCCGIAAPTPPSPPLITITSATPNLMDIVTKIQNEEKILQLLSKEASIVGPSLQRLLDLKKDVTVDALFKTRVCQTLSEKIQTFYSSKTKEGKICRKLLRYFQDLCRRDPGFDPAEELPNITDISDSETEEVIPTRSFRTLFARPSNLDQSSVLIGSNREPNSIMDDVPDSFDAATSSTISKPKPKRPKKSRIFDLTEASNILIEDSEVEVTKTKGRARKRMAEGLVDPAPTRRARRRVLLTSTLQPPSPPAASSTTSVTSPALPPRPSARSPSVSAAPPSNSYSTRRDAVKPKPLVCKKRKGTLEPQYFAE